jgi:hypothetical protein
MAHLPTFYKGAGPGTHWHTNNAQLTGFTTAAVGATNRNTVVRHIVHYSHPSPLISLTSSFAVARSYALLGPAGIATRANPGIVYEIDFSLIVNPPRIVNPLRLIANTMAAYLHTGDPSLILNLAQRHTYTTCHHAGGRMLLPTFQQELYALVYALRDAEVLATAIPNVCVFNQHSVY